MDAEGGERKGWKAMECVIFATTVLNINEMDF